MSVSATQVRLGMTEEKRTKFNPVDLRIAAGYMRLGDIASAAKLSKSSIQTVEGSHRTGIAIRRTTAAKYVEAIRKTGLTERDGVNITVDTVDWVLL